MKGRWYVMGLAACAAFWGLRTSAQEQQYKGGEVAQDQTQQRDTANSGERQTATAPESSGKVPPIPVVTGFMAFQTEFAPGTQTFSPVFDPTVLVPIGHKLLIEVEFEMQMDLTREQGEWGPAVLDHSVEYLQLDYLVNSKLSFAAGRFLTPFGIYRERLHPYWIRDLAGEPMIFSMNDNSSNGAMLRGATQIAPGIELTYAGYFSAAATNKLFEADRRAGGRGSLFLPNKRMEIGVSYSRTLSNQRYNMLGADLTWNLKKIPVDVKGEAIYSSVLGKGYWLEGAYRLNRLGKNAFVRNSELALRGEQYFVPGLPQTVIDELPTVNTTRATFGWNYYLHNGLRFNASYGRNFASGDNHNIWTAGVTLRFAKL
jgi:hypothetical protein